MNWLKEIREKMGGGNLISTKDFLFQRVDRVEEFSLQGPVTRRNFVSWIDIGMRLTLGQPMAYFVFMEWCRVNLGFDYQKTIDNFVAAATYTANQHRDDAKKWDFLSASEIGFLANSFKRFPAHRVESEFFVGESEYYQIIDAIETQLTEPFGKDLGDYPGFVPPNMQTMKMPANEFKAKLQEYALSLRNKSRKTK